jgi:hypothetical protein
LTRVTRSTPSIAPAAARLAPDISVFSSDPAHKSLRHPHGEVVRDFLRYGPVQVDKENSVTILHRLTT